MNETAPSTPQTHIGTVEKVHTSYPPYSYIIGKCSCGWVGDQRMIHPRAQRDVDEHIKSFMED